MKYRARRLVNVEVQLRVVLTALAVASLVLSANFFLWLAAISNAAAEHRNHANIVIAYDTLRATMTRQFLLCIGLSIPMAVGLGIFYSFKFAGPIYRFTRYFAELVSGRWDKPCSIRKGDDLQNLCRQINTGLEPMRSALRESQSILAELSALTATGAVTVTESDRERFSSLLGRIDAANNELSNRLQPQPVTPALAAAPAEGSSTTQREPEHDVARV